MPLASSTRVRLEDYLNDKIQTPSDLDNIDTLLAQVRQQQGLLRKQLEDAQEDLQEQEISLQSATEAVREKARKFQTFEQDIDRRLQIVTLSEVSDDAAHKFERHMSRLRRIELAERYIELRGQTTSLAVKAQEQLKSQPEDAMTTYASLFDLVRTFQDAQIQAEGAAPQLLDYLVRQQQQVYKAIEQDLTAKLQKSLDAMNWPAKELKLLGPVRENWTNTTRLLLKLQEPELLATNTDSPARVAPVVLPLKIMVQPLEVSFRYHFYGDRQTNRLDKPEYFFSRILDILEWHGEFMAELLQPILDSRIQENDQLENAYTDAISSFITAMLPMVSVKCLSLLPRLKSQPQLMSHLIHEIMSFDETLRDSWAYAPFPGPLQEWKGLTWEMLNTHGFFGSWLEVEKDFALTRYKSIRDSSDSNEIDYEGLEPGRTKPTKGAVRVNDLLETITDRYRKLTSFSQKMKFLMDIQLSIFDDYHGHLHGIFQGYLATSHTAGRLIQGATADDSLGLRGLEVLTKIFGSADYLERKMADWSDDVFFLELWEELQDRAAGATGAGATVGKDLRIEEVAARTSATIRDAEEAEFSDHGALFDETAASYRRLRERAEAEIVRALEINARNAMKPYTRVATWSSLSTTITDASLLTPSSALDSLQQSTSALLEFLSRALAPVALRKIVKPMCAALQKEILDNVVLRNSFSTAGAAQLQRDLRALCDTINASIKMRGEAERHFVRLEQAVTLLSLPIKSTNTSAGEDAGDDGWGFDDEEDGDTAAKDSFPTGLNDKDDSWGLWQAEKALFANNETAREALSSIGLTDLSESEARNIIKRRIEIGS